MLSQVKLIAEPWDLGEGGYQVGNFPVALGGVERQVPRHGPPLLEGRRRPGRRARLPAHRQQRSLRARAAAARTRASTSSPRTTASRCTTSSATTTSTTRPTARRTATATTTTIRWNCGVEGETDDPAIIALRERQKRNFLATLLLSQGVPMLLARRRDRAARSRATTTPTARTTSSPGSTGSWTRDARRCSSSRGG